MKISRFFCQSDSTTCPAIHIGAPGETCILEEGGNGICANGECVSILGCLENLEVGDQCLLSDGTFGLCSETGLCESSSTTDFVNLNTEQRSPTFSNTLQPEFTTYDDTTLITIFVATLGGTVVTFALIFLIIRARGV